MGTIDPATAKMKHLLIFAAFATIAIVPGVDVVNRAPSDYQNCDCQCNSDKWTDGNGIKGNCLSPDRTGAHFCYVSGRALCSCRDIQVSSFLKDNNGRFKYYSYEACATPRRNQCTNHGLGNYGDGDFPHCSGGYPHGSGSHGHNSGFGNNNGGNYGSGSGGHNSGFGNSGGNFGSGGNYGSGSGGFGISGGNYGNNGFGN